MHFQRTSAHVFIGSVLLCAAGLPAAAQTAAPAAASHPAVPHAASLIKVSACNPALNVSQTGGWVGYSPGWVGWRGGYWGDVYGGSFYQPPVTTTMPELGIDYTNISHKTMKQIEFGLVANGILLTEVKDVGTFSPNAEIKHKFGISANVFPIRTGMPQCVPLRITYADGTKWRNPMLPPKNQHIYYHP